MIVGHIGGSSSGGYEIQKSLRFRASASAYLSRTPTVAGNRKTWTWSGWVKRGALGTQQFVFEAAQDASNRLAFIFGNNAADSLTVLGISAGATLLLLETSAAYRDPSSHYHIVVAVDTTQATASNRTLLYVNGVQVTAFATATYPTQNFGTQVNAAVLHRFGVRATGLTNPLDGYLSEINFIDGQALDPSYFGQVSAETGAWIPKKYTGTYGTNGFYLPFNDGSTLGNLAADRSGNGNNWTANNISLTAGATYDSMLDVPTLYADRGNYAVVNPLIGAELSITNGNLTFSGTSASNARTAVGTFLMTSGKWYFEMTSGSTAIRYPIPGIQVENTNWSNAGGGFPGGYAQNGFGYGSDGNKYVNNGAGAAFGSSFTSGDVIGIAVDIDSGKVWASKNGVWQASGDPAAGTNPASTFTAGSAMYPGAGSYSGAGTHQLNFGQRPFAYTPPTGFKALCTKNLPEVPASLLDPTDHHIDITVTKSGDTNFTLPWDASVYDTFFEIKRRDASGDWYQIDGLRGYDKILKSNSTAAETTDANVLGVSGTTCTLKSTLPNGVYIIYAWKAGRVTERQTNTDGSITSTVSRNVPSGFSIVTWTGDLNAASTVGHGLGKPLSFLITHGRGTATEWMVKHTALASNFNLILNQTLAANSATATYSNGGLSNLGSSTTFGFLSGTTNCANANPSATMVAYCFAEIPGFSKFGSYTGNGSADGPFVYCGFRPRWVMVKLVSGLARSWILLDAERETANPEDYALYANLSDAETFMSSGGIDFTANGFKLRSTDSNINYSGNPHIFIAFAEAPFQFANAR